MTADQPAAVAPPTLPFTLYAGSAGLRRLGHRLRATGPAILLGVVVAGAWAALQDDRRAAMFSIVTVLVLVLLIFGVGALSRWAYRRSSITVTETEVVVQQRGRKVLPRAELGKALLGFFGNRSADEGTVYDAITLALTRRDGSAFVRLRVSLWPAEGLDQAVAALGLTAEVASPEEERRIAPWPARHLFLTTMIVIVALVALGAGAVLVGDAVRG